MAITGGKLLALLAKERTKVIGNTAALRSPGAGG